MAVVWMVLPEALELVASRALREATEGVAVVLKNPSKSFEYQVDGIERMGTTKTVM